MVGILWDSVANFRGGTRKYAKKRMFLCTLLESLLWSAPSSVWADFLYGGQGKKCGCFSKKSRLTDFICGLFRVSKFMVGQVSHEWPSFHGLSVFSQRLLFDLKQILGWLTLWATQKNKIYSICILKNFHYGTTNSHFLNRILRAQWVSLCDRVVAFPIRIVLNRTLCPRRLQLDRTKFFICKLYKFCFFG